MTLENTPSVSRRQFLRVANGSMLGIGIGTGFGGVVGRAVAAERPTDAEGEVIPGFGASQRATTPAATVWEPVSDRKIRAGIAGYGLCQFGAQFFFQSHPNVEVVAVSDLDPKRCAELAKACRCERTYESCERMIEDDQVEAVFIATDAPSHARLATGALAHGKHVASAVPAVFGLESLEDSERLYEAVKASGRKYMMFETSSFHADCYAWRQAYQAGELGKLIYSEGEYYHPRAAELAGYNPESREVDAGGWRKGLVPMWYPTHATAYYVSVSGGRLTEVSCRGMPSIFPNLQPDQNAYGNPFGTEVAMFKTSEGGMSRMAVSWDMPSAHGERGRVYGQKQGGAAKASGARPPLPPNVAGGGHGGSHGYLTNDFVESILLDREPMVGIGDALNMTLAGFVAHQSSLNDGEWLKVPQFV